MNTPVKLPFYAKASLLIIGSYFFISILSIGQDILLPIIYATIFAAAISPVVNFLVRKRIHRALSIAIVLLTVVIFAVVLIGLFVSQAGTFSEALPQLTNKFQLILNQTISWASEYFNIRALKINAWITVSKLELLSHSSTVISSTLSAMSFVLEAAVLSIVYICMILYYQAHLILFVHQLFSVSHNSKVSEMLTKTKTIIQSYLSALLIEFIIIAVMNIIGLLLLGIDYAVLLGIVGALLNIIPYLGGIIGVVLFMAIALLTKTPAYVFYVLALYSLIQFIDNNYIVPKIIGSKVKLNALVTVIAVIGGAALWGIPGMFLSIPLTAIIKLICDNIDPLKPWGFLLGDET